MRLGLFWGLLALSAEGQTTQGVKPLIEIVRSTGLADSPKVPYSPRPLELAAGQTSREPAAATRDYVRALGSVSQNSRTPGSPGAGQWHILWDSPLPSPVSAVMVAGSRVLVQRGGGWTLFDRGGKQIAEGVSGGAVITADPRAGAFYSLGNGNFLQAIALDNGDIRFTIPLGHNESFAWPMFDRSGKRIIAAGVEQPRLAPKPRPTEALFQVTEVATPLKLSPYKVLLSMDYHQDLVFRAPNMIPVASGDILWAVLPDLLIRTSPAQNIEGAWSGSFRAISASADETGWLHMVVASGATGNGDRELWIVTPQGRRTAHAKVPPACRESKYPPAIGYDHRVYLVGSQSVAAFSPDGRLLWESEPLSSIAGVSVTPDHRVVVASGSEIIVLDSNGKPTRLAKLSSPARTCPVVTAEGEILVGTESNVLCLAPR